MITDGSTYFKADERIADDRNGKRNATPIPSRAPRPFHMYRSCPRVKYLRSLNVSHPYYLQNVFRTTPDYFPCFRRPLARYNTGECPTIGLQISLNPATHTPTHTLAQHRLTKTRLWLNASRFPIITSPIHRYTRALRLLLPVLCARRKASTVARRANTR